MKAIGYLRVSTEDQAVKGVSDFIDRAAERVLEMQGRVEEVRGPAAASLQEYGNIGAFLRW